MIQPFYTSNDWGCWILAAAVLLPLFVGLALLFVPLSWRKWANAVGLTTVFATLACVIALVLNFKPDATGYAFVTRTPLGLENIGANFSLGLNAFSWPMALLTAIVGCSAGLYLVGAQVERRALLWSLMLIALSGAMGAFASVDLFYSFFFHEIALLPTFLGVAMFGGQGRRHVAVEVGLYLLLGSLLVLAGMLMFYFEAGIKTFDLVAIREHFALRSISADHHMGVWVLLMLGGAVLTGLWPFYSWVPKLLGTAPTAISLIHVGALKMFPFYFLVQGFAGWIHFGVFEFAPWAKAMAFGSLILLGLAALHQGEFRRVLSYLTLVHVGVIVLALLSYTYDSMTGIVLAFVGSGLAMTLLFVLAGALQRRVGSLELAHLSGLRAVAPRFSAMLMVGLMAVVGLPGFVGFWGEFGMLLGIARTLPISLWVVMISMVIVATIILRVLGTMLMGRPKPATMADLTLSEASACYLAVVPMIFFMIFPSIITGPLKDLLPLLMPFKL